MRIRILLSLIVFAATAALAQPAAHADGPRFIMEPNYWPKQQAVRRNTYNNYNNLAPAAATVRSGSTPSATSILGRPLASIKRQAPMQVAPVMQPNVMAQAAPSAFNPAFGRAMLPMTAQPQSLPMSPEQPPVAARKMVSPAKTYVHTQNAYPKLQKRTNSANNIARSNQIKNYNSGFESGSTDPSSFASSVKFEQKVGAKLINK